MRHTPAERALRRAEYDIQQADQLAAALRIAKHELSWALGEGPCPKGRVWVTVVHETMEYGGGEEGGWWYTYEDALQTVNVPLHMVHRLARSLATKWFHLNDPQRASNYHSEGKIAIKVSVEPFRFVRPHYE
jgi:hypothetical protein